MQGRDYRCRPAYETSRKIPLLGRECANWRKLIVQEDNSEGPEALVDIARDNTLTMPHCLSVQNPC